MSLLSAGISRRGHLHASVGVGPFRLRARGGRGGGVLSSALGYLLGLTIALAIILLYWSLLFDFAVLLVAVRLSVVAVRLAVEFRSARRLGDDRWATFRQAQLREVQARDRDAARWDVRTIVWTDRWLRRLPTLAWPQLGGKRRRRSRRHVVSASPSYSHGTCTIRHRSAGAVTRCTGRV